MYVCIEIPFQRLKLNLVSSHVPACRPMKTVRHGAKQEDRKTDRQANRHRRKKRETDRETERPIKKENGEGGALNGLHDNKA